MTTPNPLAKTKGAGTTFWMYTGKGDAFANPLTALTDNTQGATGLELSKKEKPQTRRMHDVLRFMLIT